MTRTLATLIGVALTLLAACERVEESEFVGPSPAALQNPFLAASQTLEQNGVNVDVERDGVLPSIRRVVLYAELDVSTRNALAPELLAFVADGGVLIHSPPAARGDLIMQYVPAEVDERGFLEFVAAPDSSAEARVDAIRRLNEGPAIEDAPLLRTWATSDGTLFAVESAYGAGSILSVADLSMFENHAIGLHGHAGMLWMLVTFYEHDGLTIVLGDAPRTPLLRMLVREVPTVAGGLALLALFVLWWMSGRDGPLLPSPPSARRSLKEHFHAVGAFAWRHGHQEELLESLRVQARHRIADRERRDVATELGVSRAALEAALGEGTSFKQKMSQRQMARDLVQRTQILQAIVNTSWK